MRVAFGNAVATIVAPRVVDVPIFVPTTGYNERGAERECERPKHGHFVGLHRGSSRAKVRPERSRARGGQRSYPDENAPTIAPSIVRAGTNAPQFMPPPATTVSIALRRIRPNESRPPASWVVRAILCPTAPLKRGVLPKASRRRSAPVRVASRAPVYVHVTPTWSPRDGRTRPLHASRTAQRLPSEGASRTGATVSPSSQTRSRWIGL
jgi:hypothetical protein